MKSNFGGKIYYFACLFLTTNTIVQSIAETQRRMINMVLQHRRNGQLNRVQSKALRDR